MTKKIVTVTPVVTAISASIRDAIASDVKNCLAANTSAKDVSAAFDTAMAFNWTAFKGNSSALKCGISDTAFSLVADVRDTYKHDWAKAGLLNFDRRWQYVCQLSRHFIAPTPAVATTAAKGKPATKAASAEAVVCPVKKAIEQTSAIPRLVLGLKPSQCSEALRKEIAAMCGDLCELLNQIK